MLPPLKWIVKYSVIVSVGVDADTSEKGGWVWEFEYYYKCDWINEWGKVNEKSPEYTLKSSMLTGIKMISPNQKWIMFQEYQGDAFTSQRSSK